MNRYTWCALALVALVLLDAVSADKMSDFIAARDAAHKKIAEARSRFLGPAASKAAVMHHNNKHYKSWKNTKPGPGHNPDPDVPRPTGLTSDELLVDVVGFDVQEPTGPPMAKQTLPDFASLFASAFVANDCSGPDAGADCEPWFVDASVLLRSTSDTAVEAGAETLAINGTFVPGSWEPERDGFFSDPEYPPSSGELLVIPFGPVPRGITFGFGVSETIRVFANTLVATVNSAGGANITDGWVTPVVSATSIMPLSISLDTFFLPYVRGEAMLTVMDLVAEHDR